MILNRHLIGVQSTGNIVILNPPSAPMTPEEAIEFAAWLVSLATIESGFTVQRSELFTEVVNKIQTGE